MYNNFNTREGITIPSILLALTENRAKWFNNND